MHRYAVYSFKGDRAPCYIVSATKAGVLRTARDHGIKVTRTGYVVLDTECWGKGDFHFHA